MTLVITWVTPAFRLLVADCHVTHNINGQFLRASSKVERVGQHLAIYTGNVDVWYNAIRSAPTDAYSLWLSLGALKKLVTEMGLDSEPVTNFQVTVLQDSQVWVVTATDVPYLVDDFYAMGAYATLAYYEMYRCYDPALSPQLALTRVVAIYDKLIRDNAVFLRWPVEAVLDVGDEPQRLYLEARDGKIWQRSALDAPPEPLPAPPEPLPTGFASAERF